MITLKKRDIRRFTVAVIVLTAIIFYFDASTPDRLSAQEAIDAIEELVADQVLIEEGCFSPGEPREDPAPEVCLEEFFISGTEVTQAQYFACVESDVCRDPEGTDDISLTENADFPVVEVSLDDAIAFVGYLNRYLAVNYGNFEASIPTEYQWEYMAIKSRDEDGSAYCFAGVTEANIEDVSSSYINICGEECEGNTIQQGHRDLYRTTSEVKLSGTCDVILPPDDERRVIYGITGNVREWTLSGFNSMSTVLRGETINDPEPEVDIINTVRGCGYLNILGQCPIWHRFAAVSARPAVDIGFRVVIKQVDISSPADTTCDAGESWSTDPDNCDPVPGNGICEGIEREQNHPDCQDISSTPDHCPNTVCDGNLGEDYRTCPADCPAPGVPPVASPVVIITPQGQPTAVQVQPTTVQVIPSATPVPPGGSSSNGNSNGNNSGGTNGNSNGNNSGGTNGNSNGNNSGGTNGNSNGNNSGGTNGNSNGNSNGNNSGGTNGNSNGNNSGGTNGNSNGNNSDGTNGNSNGTIVVAPTVTAMATIAAAPAVMATAMVTPAVAVTGGIHGAAK